MSQAVPCTGTPAAVARRASSLSCLVTRVSSTSAWRASSRHSNQTWFWPPRHSRPESTCNTRIGATPPRAPSLRGDFHNPGEHAAQRIEFEGLLQEGTAQLFEELQRIAADRVARGTDDALSHRGVHARARLKHLASAQARHAKVANDDVERLHQRALQGLTAIARDDDLMTPAFQRGLHVVEDVRLVIDHEYPQSLQPFGGRRLGGCA